MKKLIFLILTVILFASELKITSKQFYYNSKAMTSVFIGNVKAVKDNDNIFADKLTVFFNKDKKPVKIEAIGNVRFKISMDNNSTYSGKCDKLFYYIKTGDILLIGNAFIKKIETNESISGDRIKINRITKNIEVLGNKNKPVNIIIKVNQ